VSPNSQEKVHKELSKLHTMVTRLLVFCTLIVLGISVFAWVEVRNLRSQQIQLQQLTNDLCVTLERAGILIQGTETNPCER
jgi:hypothetical protein